HPSRPTLAALVFPPPTSDSARRPAAARERTASGHRTRPMSTQALLESVVADQLKTDLPRMDIGDTINVHCRIVEGDKERIQVFQGVFIARRGRGINELITVRRIVNDQGVERIFPLNSPKIAKYEI